MEEVESEIERRTNEHLARLSREFDSLQNISRELEGKLQQPPSELLQDIRSTLQRHEERPRFEAPDIFPPKLRCRAWDFRDIYPYLEAVVEQFKGSVTSGLSLQIASVTLDPDTAHPHLIVSEDRRSARWGEARQELPDNPERFDERTFVLGREEFTAGRHIWEVTLGSEGAWAVGVAKKSVQRKGTFCFTPKEGIWGIGDLESKPRPPHRNLPLSLAKRRRIWVVVNYAGAQIAFLDADTGGLLSSFKKAAFSGEPLLPIFCVGQKSFLELPLLTN